MSSADRWPADAPGCALAALAVRAPDGTLYGDRSGKPALAAIRAAFLPPTTGTSGETVYCTQAPHLPKPSAPAK